MTKQSGCRGSSYRPVQSPRTHAHRSFGRGHHTRRVALGPASPPVAPDRAAVMRPRQRQLPHRATTTRSTEVHLLGAVVRHGRRQLVRQPAAGPARRQTAAREATPRDCVEQRRAPMNASASGATRCSRARTPGTSDEAVPGRDWPAAGNAVFSIRRGRCAATRPTPWLGHGRLTRARRRHGRCLARGRPAAARAQRQLTALAYLAHPARIARPVGGSSR